MGLWCLGAPLCRRNTWPAAGFHGLEVPGGPHPDGASVPGGVVRTRNVNFRPGQPSTCRLSTRIGRGSCMGRLLAVVALGLMFLPCHQAAAQSPPAGKPPAAKEPPAEWVEATGHRVIRLSRDPGSSSFYFHQNPYTASGDKMVIFTRGGLSTVDLQTRKVEQVVEGRAGNAVVGRKT